MYTVVTLVVIALSAAVALIRRRPLTRTFLLGAIVAWACAILGVSLMA